MKVVYISYANVRVGDLPEWLKEISFYTRILEEQARSHEVISIHSPNKTGRLTQNGVHYLFVKPSWMDRVLPVKLNKLVVSLKPDVVVVHGLHSGLQILSLRLFLKRTTKLFAWHHAEKPKRFPKNLIQRWADRLTNGYFFVSKRQAAAWIEAGQINSDNKVHEVMEASSEFFPMDRTKALQRTKIHPGKNYLWVGRLDDNKDPITLVKAFTRFCKVNTEAKLYVIFKGGHLYDEVKSLLGGSDSILLLGEVIHNELLYWYNSVDFIISTSHYEGSGIAVCEAMSCGCVPLLTNIPSFEAMTGKGRCGVLFDVSDEESLFQGLLASTLLHLDSEKNKTLLQFRHHLSFTAIASKLNEIMER